MRKWSVRPNITSFVIKKPARASITERKRRRQNAIYQEADDSVVCVRVVAASGRAALAQKRYDVATDTKIKIGNAVPCSGPSSIYSIVGRAEAAYFKQAANLKDFRSDVLLPGIKLNTGPSDFAPTASFTS